MRAGEVAGRPNSDTGLQDTRRRSRYIAVYLLSFHKPVLLRSDLSESGPGHRRSTEFVFYKPSADRRVSELSGRLERGAASPLARRRQVHKPHPVQPDLSSVEL